VPRELDSIADALKEGRSVEPVTVRLFLAWFGAYRRGQRVVYEIRQELEKLGIITDPDFESMWVDGQISFVLNNDLSAESAKAHEEPTALDSETDGLTELSIPTLNWINRDPTYRISKLAAANGGVDRVPPDFVLSQAVTLMLSRDFSQLPVMTSDREVKGMISWISIGSRLALGQNPKFVRECMEKHYEVTADTSIFDAIILIVKHGYVLVRNEKNLITGIVSASDLSVQFQTLTEPFLLLGEIENIIRNMIGRRFMISQLKEACENPEREIKNVADLTFGEYIRLLENPNRWGQLNLSIDRDIFCKKLDRVRFIRNDVMHFDTDSINPTDLADLRDFAQFLKKLEELRPTNQDD